MEIGPIVSKNPATLQEIARFQPTTPEEVRLKVEEARKALPFWSSLSFKERGAFLMKAREYILQHLDEIAHTITEDNGKPLVEAISADILPVCDLIAYFSKNTEKLLRREKIDIGVMGLLGRRSRLHYQPLGLVGIISPWNFPFSIPMSGTIMALMAGNCVLLKPADATPLVGKKIEEIFKAAGIPSGVFTHLPGGATTGEALVTSFIDKVVFTGSVRVGRRIMELCSHSLTPCTLELGGKDPMIVCEDADLENAARAAVWGGFSNAGQICASVERVYVDEKISNSFLMKVVEKTKKLKQGSGLDLDHDIGPLTTEAQLKVVEDQMAEARERGATILTGGDRNHNLLGLFYKPTVLFGVDSTFRCVREETFGPLLPIMTFKTEEEAIALANDSIYGLTASVWTKDLKRGEKIARRIRAGTVTVNDCTYSYAICQTPWGGLKNSGFGRTHGKLGLHELVHVQHVHTNKMPRLPDFWWYGYNAKLYNTFKYLARNLTGTAWQKAKAVVKILFATNREEY
jgi:succinate-semialdehyde dehydrogenase/glutarate-semialdehyde dehydrogenase